MNEPRGVDPLEIATMAVESSREFDNEATYISTSILAALIESAREAEAIVRALADCIVSDYALRQRARVWASTNPPAEDANNG